MVRKSLHLEKVAVVDGSNKRREGGSKLQSIRSLCVQAACLTPSQTLHDDSEHVTVHVTEVREVSVQRVGIWAAFQIEYFFFFLSVHTAAALKKCILLHAVCKQLGRATSS